MSMRCARQGDPRRAATIDRATGALLRRKRLALGMTQERLAGALKITFQQVQKYEKGVNRIAWARLLGICNVLGATPDEFIPAGALKRGARSTPP